MSTPLLLELFAGFLTAGTAVWFVVLGRSTVPVAEDTGPTATTAQPGGPSAGLGLRRVLGRCVRREELAANLALLLLGPGRYSFEAAIVSDLIEEEG